MGGARISQIINEEYLRKVDTIDPLVDLSEEQIRLILLNSAGITNSSFVNLRALENMIGRQLNHLIEPSLDAVDSVRGEMLNIFDSIDENILRTLKKYPKINIDVRNALNTVLDENLINLKECINSHIETYQVCLNTTNPIFLPKLVRFSIDECSTEDDVSNDNLEASGQDKKDFREKHLIQKFKKMLSGLNDHDAKIPEQVNVHKQLTHCYFEFIKEIIVDYIPKRIHHKMVNLALKNFEHQLNKKVFAWYVINQSFNEILVEEKGVVEDRERVEQMLFAVNKALKNMVDIQCF